MKIQNTFPYKIYLIKAQNFHVGDEIKFWYMKKKSFALCHIRLKAAQEWSKTWNLICKCRKPNSKHRTREKIPENGWKT
jgi:hypothetical protein